VPAPTPLFARCGQPPAYLALIPLPDQNHGIDTGLRNRKCCFDSGVTTLAERLRFRLRHNGSPLAAYEGNRDRIDPVRGAFDLRTDSSFNTSPRISTVNSPSAVNVSRPDPSFQTCPRALTPPIIVLSDAHAISEASATHHRCGHYVQLAPNQLPVRHAQLFCSGSFLQPLMFHKQSRRTSCEANDHLRVDVVTASHRSYPLNPKPARLLLKLVVIWPRDLMRSPIEDTPRT